MKKWFVSLRYPVPKDMEEYLENLARDGYGLQYIKQGGLFFYEFDKKKGGKCCYMVDAIQPNQGDHMFYLSEQDWEYLGKSGNLIIARKYYTDRRPEKPVNEVLRIKHCRNVGLAYLILALVLLGLCGLAAYSLYKLPQTLMPHPVQHRILYIVQMVLQFPLALLFLRNARQCFGYHPVIRQPRKVMPAEEETQESLEFLAGEKEPAKEEKKEPEQYVSIFGEEEPELDFLKK
ncbi:MAG: DUF2812 domain-containing protein [Lachnospiraceae bacterium]|nr:DUF2812 domain-containing protein [Lachnospiraceae bacterium]